ncbi:MAG: glycosyltransferase [Bacteroidales bacterium]
MKILYICSEFAPGMIPFGSTILNTIFKDPSFEAYAVVLSKDKYSYRNSIDKEFHDRICFLESPKGKLEKAINKIYPFAIKRELNNLFKRESFDIIHLLTLDFTLWGIIDYLMTKSRVIYSVHDLKPHETSSVSVRDSLMNIYIGRSSSHLIKSSHYLVTSSQSQYRELKSLYPSKSVFFHPFPSLIGSAIDNGKMKCPELYGVGNYILFFGSVDVYKGIDNLYSAYISSDEINSNFKLVIAGLGATNTINNDSKLHHNVIRINRFIVDEEIRDLFINASCVVYPYISATQSGVMAFPLKFGVRMLLSDVQFFKDSLDASELVRFFKRDDINSLASELKNLLLKIEADYDQQPLFLDYERIYSLNSLRRSLSEIYDSIINSK